MRRSGSKLRVSTSMGRTGRIKLPEFEEERRSSFSELWVVEVKSGVPVAVEAFHDRKSAEARENFLRKRMHSENDEIGVFEVQI